MSGGDPYRYFRVEGRDLLEQLEQGILDLERAGTVPDVSRLLRLAHTLKGAARVVRLKEVADIAHAMEDALGRMRDAATSPNREATEALLSMVDSARRRLAALPSTQDAPASAPFEEGAAARPDTAEIDAVVDALTEAGLELGAMQRLLEGARLHERRSRSVQDERAELARLVDGFQVRLERAVRDVVEARETADRMRLVAAGALFTGLERAARDGARELDKRVRFSAEGTSLRLDAEVLSTVRPALVQLVRNAVAHGIEGPSERERSGKSDEGHVRIRVTREGRNARFECSDDGRGIDADALRRAATRRGLSPSEAAALELDALLLRTRTSTAGAVTQASGRGVGLDVVRDAAERLGGGVRVRTEIGRGTTIDLVVPARLAALDALLIEQSGAVMAIPADGVRGTLRVAAGDVVRDGTRERIVVDGQTLPLASLGMLLDRAPEACAAGAARTAVLISARGASAAVVVERLLGITTIVLRPYPELAPAAPLIAGTAIDMHGDPQLVLDPVALARSASSDLHPGIAPVRPPPVPVLIVDDSLTTRMLERSILEAAGYQVELAVSGEDALEKARGRRFSAFLVDVEMPGMDGFEFVARTRDDPELRQVPSILVTSRSAAEDRARGDRVGARAYIVKSEFDQEKLLETLGGLVRQP